MPHSLLHLRDWLEEKLDSQSVEGTQWVVRDQGIFSIAWNRVRQGENSPRDFQIFVEWAKHKGHYSESQADYKRWKTLLRCAMNRDDGIRYLKEMSDDESEKPYRVYQFLSPSPGRVNPADSVSSGSDVSTSHDQPSAASAYQTGMAPVLPSVVEVMNADSTSGEMSPCSPYSTHEQKSSEGATSQQLPEFYETDLQADLLQVACSALITTDSQLPADPAATNDLNRINTTPEDAEMLSDPVRLQDISLGGSGINASKDLTDHVMLLRLYYLGKEAWSGNVPSQHACVLLSRSEQEARGINNFNLCPEDLERLYGPPGMQEIQFPVNLNDFMSPGSDDIAHAQDVLNVMGRGLQLETDSKGCVFATRRCRCSIFYDSHLTNGSRKLPRKERTKLFDFQEFLSALEKYSMKEARKPLPEIQLGFAQEWRLGQQPAEVLVSLRVFTKPAACLVDLVDGANKPFSTLLDPSHETESDAFLKQFTEKLALDYNIKAY